MNSAIARAAAWLYGENTKLLDFQDMASETGEIIAVYSIATKFKSVIGNGVIFSC